MSITKRHHLVPQFYLRLFRDRTAPREIVWVYDKDDPRPRSQSPKDTAVETRAYTLTRGDGTTTDDIEQMLSRVETVAAPIIARWTDGRAEMRPEERAEMAYFLGLLHGRVRRTIEVWREWLAIEVKWRLERMAKSPARFQASYAEFAASQGSDVAPVEQMMEIARDPDRFVEITANRQPALGIGLMAAKDVAESLLKMHWWLCVAPRGEFFVTSDAPLCIFTLTGNRAQFGAGLALPKTEVAFPLSPEVCLCIDDQGRQRRRRVSATVVRELNRRIAFNAERFVIGHVRSKGVERLARDAAGSRKLPKLDRAVVRRWLDDHAQFRAGATEGNDRL